ncbi:hypothetical protein MLD38_017110 [Melastoma candidum]|uniref:Uncharacterized protein n=1 Tax=Melastoma candidum TaxID=119954 RepID=A0ACB9QNT5_9MYRT|nr:hypothetical protein MLD38_017110 [Melastoma candidum]
MEAASVASSCCFSAFDPHNTHIGNSNLGFSRNLPLVLTWRPTQRLLLSCRRRSSLATPVLEDEEKKEEDVGAESEESGSPAKDGLPKVDRTGRFCSPRAGRELALSIIYAACLEGSDPVRLLEKRMNMRREPGYEFDKASLLKYNPMSFGGPPVTAETAEEADGLSQIDEKETAIEAEVLSAPPKLVYSKLILRFARKLLLAVVDRWDDDVLVIEKVVPQNWKNAPAGKIIELCILHLAMSEIAVLGTRHPIVINEAVDLAKRFCDGAAPRIINGCLRSFVKDFQGGHSAQTVESEKQVAVNA